jgi:hypothetical protein
LIKENTHNLIILQKETAIELLYCKLKQKPLVSK